MKWPGHSDYSSKKPYIDIVDDIKVKFSGQNAPGPRQGHLQFDYPKMPKCRHYAGILEKQSAPHVCERPI